MNGEVDRARAKFQSLTKVRGGEMRDRQADMNWLHEVRL